MIDQANDLAMDLAEVMRSNRGVFGVKPYFSKELAEGIRELREKQMGAIKEAWEKALETNKALLGQGLSDEKRQELTERFKSYQAQIQNLKDDLSTKAEALKDKQQQEWTQKVEAFEEIMLDAVCQYAGSIRNLPDDQYMTVLLRKIEFSEDEPRDRIYVFRKSDLLACRDGRITKEALKAKSQSYAF